MPTDKGFVRLYTGTGQGKTTAAFGLLMRVLGSGRTAYVGQFVKNQQYNETHITRYCKGVEIEQLGLGCFLDRPPTQDDRRAAQAALAHVAQIMRNGSHDLVILDEITIAIQYGLVTAGEVIDAIKQRDSHVEVVMTGRHTPPQLVDFADLVTEMREVKHYYRQGILSRPGFDH